MSSPGWDNIEAFLQLDDFAQEARIEMQDGGTIPAVAGIFDEAYLNAQIGEYELDSSQPRFTCAAVEVAQVRRGDVATISGGTYDVLGSPQPDGTGMAVIPLARRVS